MKCGQFSATGCFFKHGNCQQIKNSLKNKNINILSYLIRKSFKVKDRVINRALPSLHGGVLEITLTVPLS